MVVIVLVAVALWSPDVRTAPVLAGDSRVGVARYTIAGFLGPQSPGAAARSGALDPTFGVGGKVTTDFAGIGNHDTAATLLVLPSGRIVAAGAAGVLGPIGQTDFGLARYNPDGSLDTSFGNGGKVSTDLGGEDRINAMVAAPGGRLLVGGGNSVEAAADFALARYNIDGSLDRSFGADGIVTTDFGLDDQARALAVQHDGKVIAAGVTRSFLDPVITGLALARYRPNGSLDRSFGTDGIVTTFLPNTDGVRALVLQADGRIVAATERMLVRYNADGTLDNRFGDEGMTFVNFGDHPSDVATLAAQGNKLIAAGSARAEDERELFALARYDRHGRLDASFGRAGFVTTDVGAGAKINAVAIRRGILIAAGRAVGESSFDFALTRYHPDGALDRRFGDAGKVITDIHGNAYDDIRALAWQPDGQLVAAGEAYTTIVEEFANFALARYRIR
jgi:uncharacterized delta-60 repeat protein